MWDTYFIETVYDLTLIAQRAINVANFYLDCCTTKNMYEYSRVYCIARPHFEAKLGNNSLKFDNTSVCRTMSQKVLEA